MKTLLLTLLISSTALAQTDIPALFAPASSGANGVAITPSRVTTAYVDAGTIGVGTLQVTTNNVGTENVTTLNVGYADAGTVGATTLNATTGNIGTGNVTTLIAGSLDAGTVIINTELRSAGNNKFTGDVTSCNATGTVCLGKRATSNDGAIWIDQGTTQDHTTAALRGDSSGNTILNSASAITFQIGGIGKGGIGATGRWNIGVSGDNITQMNTGTATIDFASISAGACGTDTTVTVTGATTTAACQLGVPNGSMNAAGSMFMCYISSADTAKVRHCCINGTCDPASGSFRVWTINP